MCTRQYHLKEIRISKLAILIRIEEFDDEVAVSLCAICDSVFSQEVEQIHGRYETILVPVKPLKASVAVEGLVGTEELAKDL